VIEGVISAIILLIAGLGLLGIAGAVNARPSERLLPPDAMRPGAVAGAGYAMIFAMSAASAVFGVYGAAILQVFNGLSPLSAGYVVASDAFGWTLTALFVSGQPDERHGAFIFAGAATIVAGMVLLAASIGTGQTWAVTASGFILGSGFGLAWSLTTRRVLGALSPADRDTGAAAVPTTQLIGSAAGAALAGAVANLLGLAHAFTPVMARDASPWLFAAFVPLSVLGLAASVRLARGQSAPA
jgi:predicted MFS family arabinose efflux permease